MDRVDDRFVQTPATAGRRFSGVGDIDDRGGKSVG